MKAFKLKKIKITKNEKITILSLILLIISLILIYPDSPKKSPIFSLHTDYSNNLKKFNFDGTMQSEVVFDNQYANVVYQNKGVDEIHYIDLKNKKEVGYLDFVKDNKESEFAEKIKSLLLKKYPTRIVEVLTGKAVASYNFYTSYLYIKYDITGLLESSRTFELKVYYNEIADYLEFNTPKVDDAISEDGYNYDPQKISVSFTFDDGPNGKKTQKLVEALEDYKMSATFFMVASKIPSDATTVTKVSESHSEIGYHSLNHAYFTKQSEKTIKDEFVKANKMLVDITGKEFKLTRPPYGAYNKKTLNALDNAFIRWDLDTNDWQYKDPDYIENYVLENYQDGSIILFHDSYNTSVDAAIELMEILYLKDIQVVSVSKLAELKGVVLENHEVYYSFTK